MKFGTVFIWLSLFSFMPLAHARSECSLSVPVIESKYKNNQQAERFTRLNQELLALLASTAGCHLSLVKVPWSRALAMLKTGELSLMMTMSENEERRLYFDFIGSHSMEEVILVVHKDHVNKVKTLHDILYLPGQIAVLRDGFYGETFNQLLQNPQYTEKLLYANNVPHKMSLLEHKRVTGLIEERNQYQLWAAQNPVPASFYREHLVVNNNPVYFAASRKGLTQQQRDHLRQSWSSVYGSPAHLAILAKYGLSL